MSFAKRGAEGGWGRRASQRAALHTWSSGQAPVKQCSPGSARSWRNSTVKTLDELSCPFACIMASDKTC